MTEAEWLACGNAEAMLTYLGSRATERKVRLFALSLRVVDAASTATGERIADGVATEDDLVNAAFVGCGWGGEEVSAWELLGSDAPFTSHQAVLVAREACRQTIREAASSKTTNHAVREKRKAEQRHQATTVRDIFGNPFHHINFDAVWLTPTVKGLAQAAYDHPDRSAGTLDASRLAILADALEDSGCDSADILDHLRSPGPHVRGCWALDLILAKG